MEQTLDYRIDMSERSRWEILSPTGTAKQHLLYLQETGLFYSGQGYYTTREGLDSYLVKLTLSGSGILTYDGRSYTLRPGDFFWIDCSKPQDYRTAPDADHWYVIWIHFNGPNAKDYYELFTQCNDGNPVGHLNGSSNIPQLMEHLTEFYPEKSCGLATDIRCANLLTQLLTGLLDSISPTPQMPALPPSILAVRDHISQNYNQTITLDDLSQRFNISKFYLQRTFRKYTGYSPYAFQQNIRIAKAKELLRTTDLPVNIIAYTVGFESSSAFIAVFKSQEGITPLKYRTVWSDGPKP